VVRVRGCLARQVFLTGEAPQVVIIIDGDQTVSDQSKNFDDQTDSFVCITSLLVRFHGHLRVDPRWIPLGSNLQKLFGQNELIKSEMRRDQSQNPIITAEQLLPYYSEFLSDNSACIVTTAAHKLINEPLKIFERSRHFFVAEFIIPEDIMPSFRGVAVRCSYVVSISTTILTQSGKEIQKHLHIPLTIYSPNYEKTSGILTKSLVFTDIHPIPHPLNDHISNQYLPSSIHQSNFSSQVSTLEIVSSKNIDNPTIFTIHKSGEHIGKFLLFKNTFFPGDQILGTIDFSGADLLCNWFKIDLEKVQQYYIPEVSKTEKRDNANTLEQSNGPFFVDTFDSQCEIVIGRLVSPVHLNIPNDIAVNFQAGIVSVKWKLSVELSVQSKDGSVPPSTLNWSIPLNIVPFSQQSLAPIPTIQQHILNIKDSDIMWVGSSCGSLGSVHGEAGISYKSISF